MASAFQVVMVWGAVSCLEVCGSGVDHGGGREIDLRHALNYSSCRTWGNYETYENYKTLQGNQASMQFTSKYSYHALMQKGDNKRTTDITLGRPWPWLCKREQPGLWEVGPQGDHRGRGASPPVPGCLPVGHLSPAAGRALHHVTLHLHRPGHHGHPVT